MTPDQAVKKSWDVIVIGAGMGGGLAGRRLAERGLSVLFVEMGPEGLRSEAQRLSGEIIDPVARKLRGFWPNKAEATVDGIKSYFYAPVGSGLGGSSVFYAGALERPYRHDLENTPEMPHPTGGWPVGYDEFAPYYEQAEQALFISGTVDPLNKDGNYALRQPPGLSDGEASMFAAFQRSGLNPYRLHLAIKNVEGCQNCVGHKCPKNCKMDGRSAGVEPALETGHASVLSNSKVLEILSSSGKVEGLRVESTKGEYVLTARTFVLAAGAFGSPKLLLNSTGENKAGLANSSGWVGCGLMFHLNEIFAVWPKRSERFSGAAKSISMRDLYSDNGNRLGMIQSMGLEASFGNVLMYLKDLYDRSPLRRFAKAKVLLALPAAFAVRLLGDAKIFVGLMEDLAYQHNRVILNEHDPDTITFEYTVSDELKQRRTLFRKSIRRAFKGHRKMFLGQTLELNYGHPSGTLRFGNDPSNSVLDRTCRAHDLANLYVADASFMPTSMGVNPSLTIAANALRVADIIADQHEAQ